MQSAREFSHAVTALKDLPPAYFMSEIPPSEVFALAARAVTASVVYNRLHGDTARIELTERVVGEVHHVFAAAKAVFNYSADNKTMAAQRVWTAGVGQAIAVLLPQPVLKVIK